MFFTETEQQSVNHLLREIGLRPDSPSPDRYAKIRQIASFLEVVEAEVRPLSLKRTLTFLDAGAGNGYLSFLLYHYFAVLRGRDVQIHCVDTNTRLMEKGAATAERLGFSGMTFFPSDILEAPQLTRIDVLYALHACDTVTDKAIYTGIRQSARTMLTVSCCQHTIRKSMTSKAVGGMTRYKALKDRLVYMVADTMRSHLVAMSGYEVDVLEFTSSRHTDKNTMIRSRRSGNAGTSILVAEYEELRRAFGCEPELARLLRKQAVDAPRAVA